MRFQDAKVALGVCFAALALGCRSPPSVATQTSARPSSAVPVSSSPAAVASRPLPSAAPATPPSPEPLDPLALPSVKPAPCAAVGRGKVRRVLSATERAPLLEAAQAAWDADYTAPIGCVEQVSISCATDLDGKAGNEVVGEIRYIAGTEPCAAARSRRVTSTRALLAFVPPTPDSAGWRLLGLIGYDGFDVPGVESPATTKLSGFVRLPDGRTALRVNRANDGADCSGQRTVDLLAAPDGKLVEIATRELRACNAP